MVDISGVKTIFQARNPPEVTVKAVKTRRSLNEAQKLLLITSKVHFEDIDRINRAKIPVQHQEVAIYEKGLFFGRTRIATKKTNDLGHFSFHVERKTGFFARERHFTYEFVAKAQPFSAYGFFGSSDRVTQIYNLTVPKYAIRAKYELEAIYANQSKNLASVAPPPTTHWQSLNYFIRLAIAVLPVLPKAMFVVIFGRWMTATQVQWIYDLYGSNCTQAHLTPEYLINNLMNGIAETDYRQYNDQIIWEADWTGIDFDLNNALPNVRVFANLVKNNKGEKVLKLDKIEIQYREDAYPEIVLANNGKDLKRAIYLALSVFGLKGEAEGHLGEGHILPGLISSPFFKFICKGNPLYNEIAWSLNEVQFINFLGSLGIIFGVHSILDSSALSPKGVEQVIFNSVKCKADWKNYKPTKQINEQDHFHAGEKITYEILLDYYRKFVKDNKEKLTLYWEEIYNWSQAINEHLPECPIITDRKKNPSSYDLDQLAKFLAFLVPKTTFTHWAKHTRQCPLVNIRQVSLGLQKRCRKVNGQFAEDGNTLAEDASRQLFIATVLMNFDSPSLLDNPFGDIPLKLVKLFKDNYHRYLGYPDIKKMMPGTRI